MKINRLRKINCVTDVTNSPSMKIINLQAIITDYKWV